MKKIFFIVIYGIYVKIFFINPDYTIAQFYSKPDWVNNPPEGYLNYYFIGIGVSYDYQKSLQYAIANATQKFLNKYKVESFTIIDKTPVADKSRVVIKIMGEERTLFVRIVDAYVEYSPVGYKTYVLISSPRESENIKELPTNTGALFRSLILPGWGHFYKKHKERGLLFLIFEGIGFGASTIFYKNAITHNNEQLRTKLNIILGITLSLHILGVIDSYTIEPNIRYK
ncbi:MAG: hypothetical protein QXU40_00865 [Candidatus Pacearchaeota archaeon]